MSVEFSDNFNGGVLTGWSTPNNLGVITLWGDEGTACVGCNNALSLSRKTFEAPFPDEGAIRAQAACVLAEVDPTDGALAFGVQDRGAPVGPTNAFQLLVYLCLDGSFRVRLPAGGGTVHYENTAAGLFPVDGTQFGLQVRYTIGAMSTFVFEVNDVEVATINYTFAWYANRWDDVLVYGFRLPFPGGIPCTDLITVDNYEVDSSAASVPWPDGTAPQLDVAHVCGLTTVDGLSIDCDTLQVTITGDGFIPGSIVVLIGPDAVEIPTVIVSQTYTEIVATIASFPSSGEYCVSVYYPQPETL